MSTTLQLGELQLALANLHLSAQAIATFSNPVQHWEITQKHYPADLDWLAVQRSWVERGSGLKLEVDLRINGSPPSDTHLRSLGYAICGAELWDQLGLSASLVLGDVDTTVLTSSNQKILIALSHAHSSTAARRHCIHQLCYTISAADVAPPSKVFVTALDVVKLSIDILTNIPLDESDIPVQGKDHDVDDSIIVMKRPSQNDPKPVSARFTKRGRPIIPTKRMRETTELNITERGTKSRKAKHNGSKPREDNTRNCKAANIYLAFNDDLRGLSNNRINESSFNHREVDVDPEIISPLYDDNDSFINLDSGYSSLQSSQALFTNDTDILFKLALHEDPLASFPGPSLFSFHAKSQEAIEESIPRPDLESITDLIDATLRLTIHEKRHKFARGMQVIASDFKKRLCDAVPTLWMPGYLQEISTRAPLVPTISHVFSRSLYANARSPSLRRKLEKLLVFIPDDADGETDCEELASEVHSMSEKMRFEAGSASVWRLLQQQSRPRVAQRLKPFVFQTNVSGKIVEDDELLFAANQEPQIHDNCLFDDDEDDSWNIEENLFDIIDDFVLNEEEDYFFESDNDDLFADERSKSGKEEIQYSRRVEEVNGIGEVGFNYSLLDELEFLPTEDDLFAEEDLFRCEPKNVVLIETEDAILL